MSSILTARRLHRGIKLGLSSVILVNALAYWESIRPLSALVFSPADHSLSLPGKPSVKEPVESLTTRAMDYCVGLYGLPAVGHLP